MKQLGKRIIWQRAKDYIERYQPLLVGITGSTGKTIVKDAIAHALNNPGRVRVSPHSYNTPIGVALSVLGIEKQTLSAHWMKLLIGSKAIELAHAEPEIIILELGADRPGDIDFLAQQLPFKVGLVTNVQSTHLRLFQDQNMIAHEMMSLIVRLPADQEGKAILNADDERIVTMHNHTNVPTIWYGKAVKSQFRLIRAKRTSKQGFACEVATPVGIIELHLQYIIAEHHIPHIIAALAAVHALGDDIKKAAKRLQNFIPPPGRMRLFKGLQESIVLDDTYSAAPEGMLLALDTLSEITGNRKIAILGDMLDLGGDTITWHERVGSKAADTADILITVGEAMRHAGSAALHTAQQNKKPLDVHHFDSSENISNWLTQFIEPADVILVKGSRAMRMEEVVKRLVAKHPESNQRLS